MGTDARADILADLAASGRTSESAAAGWVAIARNYRREHARTPQERAALFAERLQDYEAHVTCCAPEEVPGAIALRLETRHATRMLLPHGFPTELLNQGTEFVPEGGLTVAEMDRCSGVITLSTLAIAETGTIVLQTVPGQGSRSASLVPDYHLCLVDQAAIVSTVPEAMARLQATSALPTTFISGPSATADIEMTRIRGVHGPRVLDVILVTHPGERSA